ncbi:peptidase inhibitor family I36 protein [Actinokineospora iranica]|uniref:Peptidase inhibitor family I36 n=1 Tax=Actinokineospora iranica TaxID=1271860 RepID=A0A1G6R4Q8_9PSEU|nr:peptidase inhibitor family I36 protein [Actinokineospora iranica]SDC99639.1 Peptidase inhibitor family I36 [Actinokineospora iranica]
MTNRIRTTQAVLLAILAALTVALTPTTASATTPPPCDSGELCLWPSPQYKGVPLRISLTTTNPGECVPLPESDDTRSFANLLTRPVTLYQGRECDTEGEFDTYPGKGTYVPHSPFVVRAIQIWST